MISLLPRVSTTLKAISTFSILLKSSNKLHLIVMHLFVVKQPTAEQVVAGVQEHVISDSGYLFFKTLARGLAIKIKYRGTHQLYRKLDPTVPGEDDFPLSCFAPQERYKASSFDVH